MCIILHGFCHAFVLGFWLVLFVALIIIIFIFLTTVHAGGDGPRADGGRVAHPRAPAAALAAPPSERRRGGTVLEDGTTSRR